MDREDRFLRRFQQLFESSDWKVRPIESDKDSADLVVEAGELRYAVQLKIAKETRRALLEGLLASAILRARAAAPRAAAKPLAIVCAPAISKTLLGELSGFVEHYGEGVAWGAMDDSGLAVFQGPALDAIRSAPQRAVRTHAVPRRSDYFSDLGQWMLKILLSRQLPFELRMEVTSENTHPGTRRRIDMPMENAMALAKVADVSVASAARFVSSLREDGFLVDDEGFLKLIRVEKLLDQWRAVVQRRSLELRARWLFSAKEPHRQLDDLLRRVRPPDGRACLGLFAACDRLGFRWVSGVVPHLYFEHASKASLRQLGLRQADAGEAADVLVRQPRYPESIFRGAVHRDGILVADVLQCWLDVAGHPARGEEMAAHLYDRVIAPNLLERDP